MDQLYNNESPAFTTWVIENDLLEEPFVVIDVGVQGGAHPCWRHLKHKVRIHGFDAIEEVVEELNNRKEPHHTYHATALGDEEGTREFYLRKDNTFGSSFYPIPSGVPPIIRKVPVTRLDTLFAKGVIPPADHIKVDCDGHDPEVIRGARQYLAQSNVVSVIVETAFTVSEQYPRSHFVALSDVLTTYRLRAFDLALMRSAQPSYVAAKARYPWPATDPLRDAPALNVGGIGTVDALFCRDYVAEQVTPSHYAKVADAVTEPTTDKIIKSMINFEMHGLMDCAVELAEHFRPILSQRLDVDRAIVQLMHRPPNTRNTVEVRECYGMVGELRVVIGKAHALRSQEMVEQRNANEKVVLRIARQIYYRLYGKMPRVRLLHPYWGAMRHLIRVVDRAAEKGAANVLVVIGSGGVADTVADHLPGVHAQVSFSELLARDFSKNWDQTKFDLCMCTLGESELARFCDMVLAVAPYMSSGGKIVGFYPNFAGRSFSTDEIALLLSIAAPPWSGRIYYGGSEKSARAIRQFHAGMSSDPSAGQLTRARVALLAITPRALLANISEAAAAFEQRRSEPPRHSTSITIEIEAGTSTITELTAALKKQAELENRNRFQGVLEARQHLEKALSRISPNQPSYGSRWQPQIDAIRRDIAALRDSMACLHYAQREITFDGRPPFPSDVMQIQFREWAVENEFPNLISTLRNMYDNPLSYPESLGEFNGRKISRIFYCHARIVLAGITYANKPKRVLEIGGGYGEIARLWLTNTLAPAESYVIVDIPECLFFAEVALRAEFGHDQVAYFDGHDPGTRVLLVPIPLLGALTRSADLVINTGSMQEMTDEWIDFYIQWLARYDTRYFYSLNYIAQPIGVMGESRNLWSQRLGAEWSTRHLRLNIPLLDLEGPTRDFLEVLYEKLPASRSLKEWSIYRGHVLSKPTYVEGLDLLRQDFTIDNAKTFVKAVIEGMPYHPKELLYIVEWLRRQGDSEFDSLREELQGELGGFLSHAPAPPKSP